MKRFAWLLIPLLLSACTWHDSLYHQYRDIGREGWLATDTLVFADTLRMDSLLLGQRAGSPIKTSLSLRHRDNYPYEDLHLLVMSDFTILTGDFGQGAGQRAATQTHFQLVNDRGIWQGKGWGSSYTLVKELGSLGSLPSYGQSLAFRITVIPMMQDSLLTGIEKVGIRLSYE